MSPRRKSKRDASQDPPVEIPMTDLGWNEEGQPEIERSDRHAAGTPGGGAASGGLAGTNIGSGDPDDAELELEAEMGSGTTEPDEGGGPPYSGPSGGAVGGTPAEGRASGGRIQHGIAPDGSQRGDSTIGSKNRRGRKGQK